MRAESRRKKQKEKQTDFGIKSIELKGSPGSGRLEASYRLLAPTALPVCSSGRSVRPNGEVLIGGLHLAAGSSNYVSTFKRLADYFTLIRQPASVALIGSGADSSDQDSRRQAAQDERRFGATLRSQRTVLSEIVSKIVLTGANSNSNSN